MKALNSSVDAPASLQSGVILVGVTKRELICWDFVRALNMVRCARHNSEVDMADKQDPEALAKKGYDIIVNGRPAHAETDEVAFDQIVNIAFPDGGCGEYISYTVTYYNGGGRPDKGGLAEGENAKVKDGTVFNVTRTDRS